MNQKTKEEIISKIIELELEITSSIFEGHKPYVGDFLEIKRNELNILRCILYNFDKKFCKK